MAHRVIARSSSRTDRRCAIAAALALGMLLSAPVTPGYASGAQSAVGGQNAGQDDELPDVDAPTANRPAPLGPAGMQVLRRTCGR